MARMARFGVRSGSFAFARLNENLCEATGCSFRPVDVWITMSAGAGCFACSPPIPRCLPSEPVGKSPAQTASPDAAAPQLRPRTGLSKEDAAEANVLAIRSWTRCLVAAPAAHAAASALALEGVGLRPESEGIPGHTRELLGKT